MAILDLKSNLSQWRKPTTVESGEKKKLSESPVKAVYSTSNELKPPTDIKINKVDNSTSIQVPGAKKVDYKLFSINAKRNRGIPAISKFFGSSILNKESLFKKFIPGNIVKVSEYKEQRVKEINKVSEFIKFTPRGIQHISTIEILKTILKDKLSLYKDQLPINILKLSLYKDQLPIDILKLSLYKDQLPVIIDKLSLYKDQIPNILGKLSLYKDQRPNILDKLSLYRKLAVNGFDNLQSGARGFTLYQIRSQYLGLDTNALKYTYPKTVKFGRLNDRLAFTGRGLKGFDDLTSGAIGFIEGQKQNTVLKISQYLGISGKTYTYPITVRGGRLVDRTQIDGALQWPTTVSFGAAPFSTVPSNNPLYDTKYYRTTFGNTKTYLTSTGITGDTLEKYFFRTNSPSARDIEYKKFNLRDSSFNTGNFAIFDSPLILTGIQRKDFVKTGFYPWETWKFDDGFIRGGVVTSTQRAIVDVLRLGKWFASVKGLLFIARQAGLQASAPNTEADPLVGKRAGNGALTLISSLANTATQHLGLRFRKDAFLLKPRTTYSSVLASDSYKNRLEKIYNEVFNYPSLLRNSVGLPILTLSGLNPAGLGGAQSVYGIGATSIKRYTVSNTWKTIGARGTEVTRVRKGGILGQDDKYSYIINKPYIDYDTILQIKADNSVYKGDNSSTLEGNAQQYYTLNYEDLKNKASKPSLSTTVIKNFLLNIDGTPLNNDIANSKWISTKGDFLTTVIQDYAETSQHVRTKLQVPDYGKRGKDLRNPLKGRFMSKYTPSGDGMTDPIWEVNQLKATAIDDFIKFMFHDLNTNERFRFRAYIENVSEDFNPNWQEVKILGRADSPYIYQGFERNLSISFKAAALSRGDLMLMWDQLERLAKTTVPQYQAAAKMKGPLIKFTLGNWFINTPAFIKSLSYTVDNETPWEINLGNSDVYGNPSIDNVGELPMIVSVQVSMQIFGEVRPESSMSTNDKISATAVTADEKDKQTRKIPTHYYQGNLYPLGKEGLRGDRQKRRFNNKTVG